MAHIIHAGSTIHMAGNQMPMDIFSDKLHGSVGASRSSGIYIQAGAWSLTGQPVKVRVI